MPPASTVSTPVPDAPAAPCELPEPTGAETTRQRYEKVHVADAGCRAFPKDVPAESEQFRRATAGFDPKTDLRYIWTFELKILGSNSWQQQDLEKLMALETEASSGAPAAAQSCADGWRDAGDAGVGGPAGPSLRGVVRKIMARIRVFVVFVLAVTCGGFCRVRPHL